MQCTVFIVCFNHNGQSFCSWPIARSLHLDLSDANSLTEHASIDVLHLMTIHFCGRTPYINKPTGLGSRLFSGQFFGSINTTGAQVSDRVT